MENTSGRRWARFFLAAALLVSMVGNVAHTVLADSSISLWLRVPGAVIWPVFTFGAIEITVRMVWKRRWTHFIGRNVLLLPAIPAAITSYQHLYSLLQMMGETPFISAIGPAAIDGMMIGCTMVLLFTRATPASTSSTIDLLEVDAAEERLSDLVVEQEAYERNIAHDWDAGLLELEEKTEEIAPVFPAPRESTPRAKWDVRQVAELAVAGVSASEANRLTGIGGSTYGRWLRVARMLQSDPRATIDPKKEKLSPEYVSLLRTLVGVQ